MSSKGTRSGPNRVAYAALKHTHEKVGKRWEKKAKRGPSDPQAEGGKNTNRKTAGGVDANASQAHLHDIAKRLKVPGRSTMSKAQLVEAIQKANRQADANARAEHRAAARDDSQCAASRFRVEVPRSGSIQRRPPRWRIGLGLGRH